MMIRKDLNIIQIIWHDLGRHLSCYNAGSVYSPHLDMMAKEGILFNNHFSTGTVCVPSRCSILTGRYPHAQDLWRFNKNEISLVKVLQEAGYRTYRFGYREEIEFKELGLNGLDQDIDLNTVAKDLIGYEYTFSKTKNSMEIATEFCNFLEDNLFKKPFYACIAFFDIHRPNEAEVDDQVIYQTEIPRVLPFLPNTYESKKDVAMFEKRIEIADMAVGKILNYLHFHRLNKNTLVLFTTDHGMDLPRAKMTVYDPGIQAALILWGPEFIPAGAVDTNLHSHMDILPTILDLVGVQIPARVQGVSFAPALIGQNYIPREFIISERSLEAIHDPVRAIRTKEYKYIHNFCPGQPIPIPPDYAKKVGSEPIKKLYRNPRPEEELYNLKEDPYEIKNLVDYPEYQDIKVKLKEKLYAILEKDNDPVLLLKNVQ